MSNEITVKLKCSIEEMYNILENKGFEIVDKFSLDDTYFVSKEIDINKMLPREILKHCILIREITQYMPELRIIKMTYKNKNIAPNGDIINQENVNCSIMSVEEGKKFLNVIGYNKIMNIKENDIVYEKDGFQIAVKDVKNGENLIEAETVNDNPELDTIEKLKKKINELQIPIDTNDYFVKKAEIELKKIL